MAQRTKALKFKEIPLPLQSVESLFSILAQTKNRGSKRCCFLFTHQDESEYLSYIGLNPSEFLRIKDGQLEIENTQGVKRTLRGDATRALNKYLKKYKVDSIEGLPPFQGGVFGYLGYEMVRHFEPRLKSSGYFKDIEKNSQQIDAELMRTEQVFIFDHKNKKCFILAPTATEIDELQTLLNKIQRQASNPSLKTVKAKHSKAEIPIEKFTASLGEKVFSQGVTRLKNEIKAGEIFQAVLSDQFVCKKRISPHFLFSQLIHQNSAPYRFHLQTSEVNRIGASPEMLLKLTGSQLETHPIAGTRARGTTVSLDQKRAAQLRSSVKERAEHLMLVDLARNDIGRVSQPGSVVVTKYRQLKRFSSVMHLVSKVVGQLKPEHSALDALRACFPAGTLSGAPKIRAMEILAELEKQPRGFYGGAVVALSFTGDLDSCIAIRCAEVTKNKVVFQAGAGIVADSTAKNEYQEIRNKTHAIRVAIGSQWS
jgi:anthranilate synthase component 1